MGQSPGRKVFRKIDQFAGFLQFLKSPLIQFCVVGFLKLVCFIIMPHKRAKRTVREQTKAGRYSQGCTSVYVLLSKIPRKSDLPPSQSLLSHNDIPKSMARVLNAEAVQKAWKDRKRKLSCDLNEETRSHKKRKNADKRDDESLHSSLKIKNGESLHHFNRCVQISSN